MTNELTPVACSLSAQEAAGQMLEWADLTGHATSITTLPDGARLSFPSDLAASIADLAEREAKCCAFLTIGLRTTDHEVVLEMTSANPDALPVIAALTGAKNS